MTENLLSLPMKHRPESWEDFIGNQTTVESLRSILKREGTGKPHCIMFEGPSGCGKTTLALLFAKGLGCSDQDLRKYNISDFRGIDTAREIIKNSRYSPLKGNVKVYILDEFHKATNEFSNAILEILEFCPEHVYFILCTTEPQKVIATIRGQRAQRFSVERLPKQVMIGFLKRITKKEDVELPDNFYQEIAEVADGSPRAALNILDKIIDIEDDEEAFNAISSANFDEMEVKKLIDYLMSQGKKSWKEVSKIVKNLDLTGSKPEEIRVAIARYFGTVLLNRGDPWSHRVMAMFASEPWFYTGREKLLDTLWELCK
uniref:Putative DNA polymerase n=2 Tax=viral metagenome TaxID=1070528 RepID=A0A6M3K3W3_9ZZZZ